MATEKVQVFPFVSQLGRQIQNVIYPTTLQSKFVLEAEA
jgi:hypothetical protein